MQASSQSLSRLLRNQDGASATEYAVLVAVIIVAVVVAVKVFNLEGIFGTVGAKVQDCVNNTTCS